MRDLTCTVSRIEVGDQIRSRALTTIRGEQVPLPDPARLVHLQFRRFAGCPICNLHLRSVAVRHDEIVAAGVREVVIFHSSAAEMRPYQGDLPFDAVADPERELYQEFGVESSLRSLLDPRALWAGLRAGIRRLGGGPQPRGRKLLGLPADLLIASDGRVLAVRYGVHAADQWSVDELLRLVAHQRDATGP